MSVDQHDPPVESRPRQVTLGGRLAVVGGVFVVLAAFDALTGLRSLDTTRAIEDYLGTPPGADLGLELGTVQGLLRVLILLAAVAAVVAVTFGPGVLKGDTTARWMVSVAGVVLVLTSPAGGGVFALVTGAAAALLWTGPARDWFAGRAVREQAGPQATAPATVSASRAPADTGTGTTREGVGTAPGPTLPGAGPARTVVPWGAPTVPAASQPPVPGSRTPRSRPRQVDQGAWGAIAGSALALPIALLMLATILLSPTETFDELERQLSARDVAVDRQLLGVLLVAVLLAVVVLAVLGLVAAVLALGGRPWARVALTVVAGLAGGLCLVAIPFSLVVAALIAWSMSRLWSTPASQWYAAASDRRAAGGR